MDSEAMIIDPCCQHASKASITMPRCDLVKLFLRTICVEISFLQGHDAPRELVRKVKLYKEQLDRGQKSASSHKFTQPQTSPFCFLRLCPWFDRLQDEFFVYESLLLVYGSLLFVYGSPQ